jgi:N-acetylmuramoyl-L-alanine amidase
LVETAFVSNPEDERLLTSPDFQQQMAQRLTKGLQNFLRASRQSGLRGWLSRKPAEQ